MIAVGPGQAFLPSEWWWDVTRSAGAPMHGSLPSEPLPSTPSVAATREWADAFAAPGREKGRGRKKGRGYPDHGVSAPAHESLRMRTR